MAGQGSARVTLKEIDLSQVRDPQILPQGVPAAVVGTARKGPAFVPRTFANIQQFEEVFGSMSSRGRETNSNRVGPLALNEWLKSANAGTFLRVLGVGDGSAASAAGSVTDAGFVVGEKLVQEQSSGLGKVGNNEHCAAVTNEAAALALGRTRFLGCFMEDATGSNYLQDAGLQTSTDAVPVIRGVLMTPQGVVASLDVNSGLTGLQEVTSNNNDEIRDSAEGASYGTNAGDLVGYKVGEVDPATQGFTVILNGFSNTSEAAVISCSFDPDSSSYFSKVLNTDPSKIEELGHYLYAWWDIDKEVAVPSASGLTHAGAALANEFANMVGFLVEGEGGRDSNTNNLPNYENFRARYQTAKTPWIVSQKFGADDYKLFRLHSLDDGEIGGDQFRLLISDLRYVNDARHGSFTLTLERLNTNPVEGDVIASWKNLSLDPDSRNYIARVIGDEHTYYNFDRSSEKQRLQTDGTFEVRNNFVRVELSDDLLSGNVPVDALPTGFLGHAKLQTAVSGNFIEQADLAANRIFTSDGAGTPVELLATAQVAPIKFVRSLSRTVVGTTTEASADLAWGVKFAKKEFADAALKELSEIEFDPSVRSFAKFFPKFNVDASTKRVMVEDDGSDTLFANDRFSLENIEIDASGFNNGITSWADATYRRGGAVTGGGTLVSISRDAKSSNVKYLKFRCMFQGGFDGVNIFDKEKADLTGVASLREANEELTDSKVYTGPTVIAYQKACDVLADKSAVELQVLALPGQRASVVTDHALNSCEERFDALCVIDIEELDASNNLIESSTAKPHVANIITHFEARGLDSSFGAAYFPDVAVRRTSDNSAKIVPPSVGVLGVISRNDRIKAPWFAPAGLNRGRVNSPGVKLQMNRDLLDDLYDADVNPIYEPAGRQGEVYVFGQKTLLQGESALDRINVRRLLIDIRRKVKAIGESLLFEPNRESTLAKFSALVEPIMQDVQKRQGVARYKVQIDSSTTTQNDIENNTVRGKIYLQPLKSIEFISLDFVVTNTIE